MREIQRKFIMNTEENGEKSEHFYTESIIFC